jgi:hypothetical protein
MEIAAGLFGAFYGGAGLLRGAGPIGINAGDLGTDLRETLSENGGFI